MLQLANGKQQFLDQNGAPLAGGLVYHYAPGTTNFVTTYKDSAGQAANPNPIPLDSRGQAVIWGTGTFRQVVTDASGVLIWDQLVNAPDASAPANSLAAQLLSSLGAALVGFIHAGVGAIKRTVRDKLLDTVSVKDFGALGDSQTDDTAAIQAGLDYAAAAGKGVYVPAGTYKVRKLRIKNGCRSFWSDGATLLGSTNVHEGVIELDGIFFSSAPVQSCSIHGFKIDGGTVARRGIFAATAVGCSIYDNHIYNLSAAAPEGAIALHFGSSHNRVYSNKLEMPVGPDCVGIYCISQTVDQYSGWMNGAIADPTNVAAHNSIFGNYVDSGSHGVALFGARFCNVSGNILRGQRDRAIILSPAASYNVITGNNCLDFGSTGVHMAYGSNSNVVTGNSCISFASTGEAGIQAYVSCSSNKIQGNTIVCASKFGIYLAVDAAYNEVLENSVSGNLQKAGIGIDSDWSGALPAGALYSRPNYGPPAAPRVNWPNGATFSNTVMGNTFTDLPAGVAAISLAQIGNLATNQDNEIVNNIVKGGAPRHYLHVFEATAGQSFGHVVTGNRFRWPDPAKLFMSRGRAHFRACHGNAIFNEPGFVDFATTATPDVSSTEWISTAAFGAPTTITNFVNGMEGQRLRVRMSVNTTIQNNGNIKTKSGIDVAGGNANDYMTFENMRGTWVELSRTF